MSQPSTIAITGASGFLGRALVDAAAERGTIVRAQSRRIRADGGGVSWVAGDVRDRRAIESLLTGVDAVVHCGATLHGTDTEVFASIAAGTRIVAEVAQDRGIRLIHLSSLAVVDPALGHTVATLDDRAVRDPRPEIRGAYSRGKIAAEALLAEPGFADLDVVTVRPGQLVGDRLASVPPSLGVTLGPIRLGLVGVGQPLAVVHVEDVAEAILAMLQHPEPPRQITLVDPLRVSRRELSAACRRHGVPGSDAPVVELGWCVQPLARICQMVPGRVGRIGRRLRAMDVSARWASPAAEVLGWRPNRLAAWLRPPPPQPSANSRP